MGLVNVTLVPGQLESGAQAHAVSTRWIADTNQNGHPRRDDSRPPVWGSRILVVVNPTHRTGTALGITPKFGIRVKKIVDMGCGCGGGGRWVRFFIGILPRDPKCWARARVVSP